MQEQVGCEGVRWVSTGNLNRWCALDWTKVSADHKSVVLTLAPSAAHTDALKSLLQTLISHGVDEELAQRAVTAFEQGATLDDVL